MTEKWEEAEIQTEEALQQKEAVDDGVGSEFRLSVLPKKIVGLVESSAILLVMLVLTLFFGCFFCWPCSLRDET